MAEAIALDQNRIFPCAAWLTGQYGLQDLFVGVPVKLGKGGIKQIVELELDAHEKALLETWAQDVRDSLEDLGRLMQF